MSEKLRRVPPQLPDEPLDDEQTAAEAAAKAEPAKEAVKEAVSEIRTPEQAREVAGAVSRAAEGATERDVREAGAGSPEPGEAIEAAAERGAEKAPATLLKAAEQVAGSTGATREALEQALQDALNPEQRGESAPELEQQRSLLREAILDQMRPYQKLDARLFLAINQLPHTPAMNLLMNAVTTVMNGGIGWVAGLLIAMLFNRRRSRTALKDVTPPLWFATLIVEYPIKYYFRRRRPFIDIVQAITIGRKPGTYSFPSGHSASAFAGAWLLVRHYPRLAPLWFAIAALVGFSRIYLGVHYPGDVLSGALLGTALAESSRRLIDTSEECD